MTPADGQRSRWPSIGCLLAILTAFVVWEAVGLMVGRGWPTLSHITRETRRSPIGRWVLFGAWLWLGWHLFIRDDRSRACAPGRRSPVMARVVRAVTVKLLRPSPAGRPVALQPSRSNLARLGIAPSSSTGHR